MVSIRIRNVFFISDERSSQNHTHRATHRATHHTTHTHMVQTLPRVAQISLLVVTVLAVVLIAIQAHRTIVSRSIYDGTETFGTPYIYPDETSVQHEIQILKTWTQQQAKPCASSDRALPQDTSAGSSSSAKKCEPISTTTGALLLNNDTRLTIDQCVMNGLPTAEQIQCSSKTPSFPSDPSSSVSTGSSLHAYAANG